MNGTRLEAQLPQEMSQRIHQETGISLKLPTQNPKLNISKQILVELTKV